MAALSKAMAHVFNGGGRPVLWPRVCRGIRQLESVEQAIVPSKLDFVWWTHLLTAADWVDGAGGPRGGGGRVHRRRALAHPRPRPSAPSRQNRASDLKGQILKIPDGRSEYRQSMSMASHG